MQVDPNALSFAVKGDLPPPRGQPVRICKERVGGPLSFSKVRARLPREGTCRRHRCQGPAKRGSAKFEQVWGRGSAALELEQAQLGGGGRGSELIHEAWGGRGGRSVSKFRQRMRVPNWFLQVALCSRWGRRWCLPLLRSWRSHPVDTTPPDTDML